MFRATSAILLSASLFAGCVINVRSESVEKRAETTEAGWTRFHSGTGPFSGDFTIRGVARTGASATARISSLVLDGRQSTLAANTTLEFRRGDNAMELALAYAGPESESIRFESLDVELPSATDVVIDGSSGSIHATGLDGRLTAHTSDGEIEATTTGPLDLSSSNGSIHAAGSGGTLHTSNGEIAMVWGGTMVEGLDIGTSNGSVDVTVPRGMGFNLDVSTSNGSVDVQVGQERIETDHVGPINGGGPALHINTSNGSINVHE